jgi:hypothetical protein
MNIYLDIDGVLLINETNTAPYADELIQRLLEVYPDSVYWLTTHDWNGENNIKETFAPYLKPKTAKLLHKIKSTKWKELKTDGIDFSKKFLWLDDDLWPEELLALEKHNATDNFIMINLKEDPNILGKILQSLPTSSNIIEQKHEN